MKSLKYFIFIFSFVIKYAMSQCDSSFVSFEVIPSNVNILSGDSCFYNQDLEALEDLISINQLQYNSVLDIGTQSWFNGRLKLFVAGNYGNSSGVNDTIYILPESIGNWTSLSGLYLEWNRISLLPETFNMLKELRSLYISNNILGSVIEDMDSLSNLIYLDLGYNEIDSIPSSLCNLSNLQYLWLFNNNLTSVPDCMCSMSIDWNSDDSAWFPYFAIGGNNLCENVPECISSSENFNVSLDQFYYSFQVESLQECDYAGINETQVMPNYISIDNLYPNPFNPHTNIKIVLLKRDYVNISIYDIKGNLIDVLNNRILEEGNYNYKWNATNVSSGMYLIKVKTPTQTFIRKGLLTK